MPVKQRGKTSSRENKECEHKKSGDGSPAATAQGAAKKPLINFRRLGFRFAFVIAAMIAAGFFTRRSGQSDVFTIASAGEVANRKGAQVKCSRDYEEEQKLYPECIPKRCGRLVMDDVVSPAEANMLLRTAKSGLALGGSSGGASILDIHSGALSKDDKFINIYSIIDQAKGPVFTEADFTNYRNVRQKIQYTIAKEFEIPPNKLYLTKPTFFSKMTSKPAKTVHDEYWHIHVDKETYGSFHYTSLLYLSTYGKDFNGGRFTFINKRSNSTVEPKLGRLSFFTSGSENPHFVERVESGTRYAITVSFTCDPSKAIADPSMNLIKQAS